MTYDFSYFQQSLGTFYDSVQAHLPEVSAALGILAIGWILALLFSSVIGALIGKTPLDKWLKETLGPGSDVLLPVGKTVRYIVYYTLMLFVLVMFFDKLGLTAVTDPLNALLIKVMDYAPQIVVGVGLLVLAWIIASAVRSLLLKLFDKTDLDEKLSEQVSYDDHTVHVAKTLAETGYWLVYLFFIPAILNALQLQGILEPVNEMMTQVMTYLPKIFSAVVILAIGWCVARIGQRIATNLLQTSGLDKASDSLGLGNVLGTKTLSEVLGYVLYVIILFPVIIQSLQTLDISAITVPAMNMINMIVAAVPLVLTGIVILAIGYVLGQIASQLVSTVLANVGFNNLMVWVGLSDKSSEGEYSPSCIAGHITFITIVYFAAIEALNIMGFTTLTGLLEQFIVLGGQILLGLIIFAVGLFLANYASKSVEASKAANATLLALVAKISVIALAGSMALRQMGLANEIINQAFGITLGALGVAFAISFGLGGRDFAAKQLGNFEKSLKKK